ncbi:hypothetical protein BK133_15885 [Paenibacillus sp. FSL H8-0548]|uniref:copper resistance CopC family protein n=1 Tax=Paenibacillus sp. FSL H8-0548 TaxID=1920422 RepID=UPI00096F94B5|nr:copper resistance CopC family protein [Paenibacillus sp. FSL H8-0548]OMF31707.1 hypothetical protein BK133_15885 [Paenibacillus sp. FSL H8-0548]
MKKILFICLAMLWLVPGVAMAHSTLEEAAPAQDSTVAVSPEQIELTFNTKIEKLSNFKLLNAAGEDMDKNKIEVDGMTMSSALPTVLPNGIYTVKWTIIGADGHSVEGSYAFTVDAPEVIADPTAEPEAATEAPSDAEDVDLATPAPAVDEQADNNDKAATNTDDPNYTPAIVIGTIIVIAAFIMMLRRRK